MNEAYNEIQKVVKGIDEHGERIPISLKAYMRDKFMIGALFSPNMNDVMDDVIDSINKVGRHRFANKRDACASDAELFHGDELDGDFAFGSERGAVCGELQLCCPLVDQPILT